ncbi:hypothetical protein NHQ30_001407 [Ciborinia camelliae]|nr:hypothetical protein NHQ30_001407 [Ciborinia camelliae]
MSPPKIHTYHCTFCTNLLLATTHTLSALPSRRGKGDGAVILPVVGEGVGGGDGDGEGEGRGDEVDEVDEVDELPSHGYTTLISLSAKSKSKSKPIVVRCEDGFEKRVLWRCGRCAVAVGYEVLGEGEGGGGDGLRGMERGKAKEKEMGVEGEFEGTILYLLRGGLMSTEFMAGAKGKGKGMKVGERDADLEVLGRGVRVWE